MKFPLLMNPNLFKRRRRRGRRRRRRRRRRETAGHGNFS
jgi:hypothetical protein